MSTSEPATAGRRPTMADVAARAGVSRALVSTVFRAVPGASALTRARVLQAADDLGYRMDNHARLLRRSRTQLLGVMFRLHDAFHADLVETLYPAAESAGYELMLSAVIPDGARRPEDRAIDTLLDNRCEALLLIGPQMPDDDLTAIAQRLPTVVVARPTPSPGCDIVRTDDTAVMRFALDHLTGLGHRDITHVDGGEARSSAERREAYQTLMQDHGLAEYRRVVTGGLGEAAGRAAAEQVLGSGTLPTAIVTFDDSVAVGVMFALRGAGIEIPGQVSLVGFDDIAMAALPQIDLTTVGQDVEQTARRAVGRAVARLDQGEDVSPDVLIAPYLTVRGTTGVPPQVKSH